MPGPKLLWEKHNNYAYLVPTYVAKCYVSDVWIDIPNFLKCFPRKLTFLKGGKKSEEETTYLSRGFDLGKNSREDTI